MFRQISLMRAVSRLAPLCYKAARFVKLYADVRRFSARAAALCDSRDVAERGAGALKFRHHGGARRVPPRARAFAPEVLVLENYKNLARFSKEQLIELVGIYAKNWLAMDGVWFQSVERRDGMEAAMYHDAEAWRRFTVIEAKRIKEFLRLPERAGLEGLASALRLRFYANLNEDELVIEGDTLVYTMVKCRVQTARERKGMPFHPCRPVGSIEYAGFARTIDDRISCRCLSCYPEVTDESCCCKWEFTLERGKEDEGADG